MKKVVVVDYDPAWPRIFEQLRAPVLEALGDVALSIEHVGSTSVPGLAAKPVIDIDVVVAEGAVAGAIKHLATLGYSHRGDLGVPTREAFQRPMGLPRHHLYLCPATSPALANHLAVRDHLRAHPVEAAAYGALKKRLAGDFPHDIDGYMAGKTDFLVGVLRKARFDADALDEVVRLNSVR
ncbi:MAG TPA: GrpB family protein [Longimicrobiales bacterium]|nr:GrpB family protein [Longimicrobiales bacterium]